MSKISQSAEANVVTLVRVGGRCFALRRIGERVHVTPIKQRDRPTLVFVSGNVVPFPARGR